MNPYDKLATFYDHSKLEEDYDYFIEQYINIARDNGLKGNMVLDIGCGTGASMLPLLKQGYQVDGVDSAVKMLDKARPKIHGYEAELYHQDITRLNIDKVYDLVIAVDDVLNHLLSKEAVEECLKEVSNHLKAEGLFLFDMNTVATFRQFFNGSNVYETPELTIVNQSTFVDDLGIAKITAFIQEGDHYIKNQSNLVERYYTVETIDALLACQEMELRKIYGYRDRKFHDHPNEDKDLKLLFLAGRKPVSLD